jgi:hypothetical protein
MVLVHLRIAVRQCRGYLAGDHHTVSSVVLARGVRGWAIASLHNTLVGSAYGGGG